MKIATKPPKKRFIKYRIIKMCIIIIQSGNLCYTTLTCPINVYCTPALFNFHPTSTLHILFGPTRLSFFGYFSSLHERKFQTFFLGCSLFENGSFQKSNMFEFFIKTCLFLQNLSLQTSWIIFCHCAWPSGRGRKALTQLHQKNTFTLHDY